jgi:hypothetical protein
MVTEAEEAANMASLLKEDYYEILCNYNKFASKFLGESATSERKRKRNNEVVIRYSDEKDFVNQMAAAFAKAKNTTIQDSVTAMQMVDDALEAVHQARQQ